MLIIDMFSYIFFSFALINYRKYWAGELSPIEEPFICLFIYGLMLDKDPNLVGTIWETLL